MDHLQQIIIDGAVQILFASFNAQTPGQHARDEARQAPNGKDPRGHTATQDNQPPRTPSPQAGSSANKRQRLLPKEDIDNEYVEEEIKQEN